MWASSRKVISRDGTGHAVPATHLQPAKEAKTCLMDLPHPDATFVPGLDRIKEHDGILGRELTE